MESAQPGPNVEQAAPFFGVADMTASLRFYVEGLGFERTKQWVVDGQIRWCWLALGAAALMLQEFAPAGRGGQRPAGKLGAGVCVCFLCKDALAIYNAAIARGVNAGTPFVGNAMWVTMLTDPDGYQLLFESPTDVAEETVYASADQAGAA